MKWTKIVKKYYEFVITKFKVLKYQRCFKFRDVNLKYMYKSVEQSEVLAIVFSACTRPGLAARYNYVKTLDGMKCNRLYILDDFGEDKRGSYYLGKIPEFLEQQATISLIQKIIKDTTPKKILFCGSCKGGYAALNIGTRFENSVMIIGEPTYKIASEFRLDKNLMRHWMGQVTEEKISYLDNYLCNQLANNSYKENQRIELFYSLKDEYYEPHTMPLLQDLERNGYDFEKETSDFAAHADLGLYFADFLKKHVEVYL